MKMLARAALALSALLVCAPALAQHAATSYAPAGYAPEQACVTWSGGSIGVGSLVPCATGPGSGSGGGGTADVAATGTIAAATANAAYTQTVANGQNTVAFSVTGLTASGAVLTLEGSNDNGATWASVYSPSGTTGIASNTFTTDGGFSANVAGRTRIRLRVSTAGTGTITVASNLSVALREVRLDAPLPPGPNKIGSVDSSNVIDQSTVCLLGSTTTNFCDTAVSLAANGISAVATISKSGTYGVECVMTGAVKMQEQYPDGSWVDSGLTWTAGASKNAFGTMGGQVGTGFINQPRRMVDISGAANSGVCRAMS